MARGGIDVDGQVLSHIRWGPASVPAELVRGALSKYVRDGDADEMARRLPALRVQVVQGAGHAVQSDRPLDLVRLIEATLRLDA